MGKSLQIRICVLVFALLVPAVSCHMTEKAERKTDKPFGLLPQSEASPDSIGIEIFQIRINQHEQDLLQQLWREVDEQMVPLALRRELMGHGFRVGIQGSYVPPTLSKLINITAPTKHENDDKKGDFHERSVADVPRDPTVTRQYHNLMPGMRALKKPFEDPVPEFALFWSENDRFCGQTYKDAIGLIAFSAHLQPDGTVRFDIVPELEYGVPETKFRSSSGMFFMESGRPRRVFESLAVSLNLLQGQWIVLGPASRNSIGLGRVFFSRGLEESEQKIFAIRLLKIAKPITVPNAGKLPIPEKEFDFSIPERN